MLPAIKTENDEVRLAEAQAELSAILVNKDNLDLGLSEEAQQAIQWWDMSTDRGKCARVLDMAKRFALIIAATCGESTITEGAMKLGLQFADYQLALYQKLMPDDSANFTQAFENKILAYFGKHPRTTERDCRNSIKPEKCPGGFGAFNQAFTNLSKGALVKVAETRKGKPMWMRDAA